MPSLSCYVPDRHGKDEIGTTRNEGERRKADTETRTA